LGRLGLMPLQWQYIEISSSTAGTPIETAHKINFNKKCHGDYFKMS
jgi:hypothetical protein